MIGLHVADAKSMRTVISDFFRRWPGLAIFGSLVAIPALLLMLKGLLDELAGGDGSGELVSGGIFLWISGIAWGGVLSNTGYRDGATRSFPLCLSVWLLKPTPRGEVKSVDRWEADEHDPRLAPLYLVAFLPIVLFRVVQYARDRAPRRDDLITILAPPPNEGYFVAEITRSAGSERVIRPLARCEKRPRAVRLEEMDLTPEPEIELRDEQFTMLKPRMLWRGDRFFYDTVSEGERVRKRQLIRSGDFSAIEAAGKNVERLEADPHAFDEVSSGR